MNNKGISLISLIITIIVIIILAAIVIFSGFNTMQKAQLARYVSEVSGLQDAVTNDYANRKQNLALKGITRTDEQVYYMIASGKTEEEVKSNEDIKEAKNVSELGIDIKPTGLTGEVYYRITSDTNINKINSNKEYGSKGEVHYLTDKGEVFILPGYRDETEEGIKYWINASQYYMGEESIPSEDVGNQVLPATIQVGDYIQYAPGEIWRVWEVDKSNNKVVMTTRGDNFRQINFTGGGNPEEWLTAQEQIEKLCDELANEELGITADDIRGMTIEDIEKVIENLGTKQNTAGYKYGDSLIFDKENVYDGKATFYAKKSSSNTFDGHNTYVSDGIKIEKEGDTVEIVNTCWSADNVQFKSLGNTKEGLEDQTYMDLFRNYGNYLTMFILSSPCVGLNGAGARFLHVLCRCSL